MESLVNLVNEKLIKKNEFPSFSAGDTITVYYEIREGDKVRTQFFKGVVIQVKGRGQSKTFTIRKMSGTIGVERIFPVNMPGLKKIEVNKSGKVRPSPFASSSGKYILSFNETPAYANVPFIFLLP